MSSVKRLGTALGLIAVLAVAASGALTACGRTQPVTTVGITRIAPEDREAMPAISGPLLGGGTGSIADGAGRVVVLNNWASWCEPCREEIPLLVDAFTKADPSDVHFLGLNVSDEAAAATGFVTETGMPYDSIVDADGALLATIAGVPAKALPSTVVIDRQGRIAARIIGPVRGSEITEITAEVASEQ
jgi:thiol-disulfide isomerase/thioredoxin